MNVMATLKPAAHGDPLPFKLRIEDYELLDRAGAFHGQRVELIEGVLIAMSPQRRPHSYLKNELTFRFRLALAAKGSDLSAQSEPTVQISATSAPEPDIALTTAPKGEGYVPIASVAMVVEIADTSMRFDMAEKRDIYAEASVPEYWVIDVGRTEVHRFHGPADGAYRQEPPVPLAGELRSLTIPDLAIDGTGIL
jgi:Uma2 family endonuclease